MENLILLFIFFFGAIIGSFLNVVILRFRSGRGLGGRSGCFTCGKTLTFFELIPIGSFFSQGGKCVGCKAPISWQYPIVEALTGILFVFIYFRFSYLLPDNALLFGVLFLFYALITSILIVLSVYDFRHKILPDKMTVIFASIAVIGMFFLKGDAVILHIPTLSNFLAGILLPAPFAAMWLLSKGKWMGLGDSKLMIGIGFLLGFSGGITAIMFAFWIGAVFAILFLVISKLMGKNGTSFNTAIPFGPFLAIGTFLVIIMQLDFNSLLSFFAR